MSSTASEQYGSTNQFELHWWEKQSFNNVLWIENEAEDRFLKSNIKLNTMGFPLDMQIKNKISSLNKVLALKISSKYLCSNYLVCMFKEH